MSRDPAYWPWARILFGCLAVLMLAVMLLLLFGGSVLPLLRGSVESSGRILLLSGL